DGGRGRRAPQLLTHVLGGAAVEARGQQLVKPPPEQGLLRVGQQKYALAGADLDVKVRTKPRTVQHGSPPLPRDSPTAAACTAACAASADGAGGGGGADARKAKGLRDTDQVLVRQVTGGAGGEGEVAHPVGVVLHAHLLALVHHDLHALG